jgi:hypothetical protein
MRENGNYSGFLGERMDKAGRLRARPKKKSGNAKKHTQNSKKKWLKKTVESRSLKHTLWGVTAG